MTGLALAALATAVALLGTVLAVRLRRRVPQQRPLVLARAGGRAFADHLGSLSEAGAGLEIPSVHGAWRHIGSLASSR